MPEDNLAPLNAKLNNVVANFSNQLTMPWLFIDVETQHLFVVNANSIVRQYAISTSKYGVGCEQDSFLTPLGAHIIAEKIGANCQLNEIMTARQATGKCAKIILNSGSSHEDLVLTRILWLRGLEQGKNLGPGIDSYERYIYIHGTQEEGLIGKPASHGCIRMMNNDVIELYEIVEVDTFVFIV